MSRLALSLSAAAVFTLAASATLAGFGDEPSARAASAHQPAAVEASVPGAMPAEIAASTNPRARSAVMAQIEAIKRDDTPSAYKLTSAGVRRAFPTGDAFMTMIRTYYPAMHRPRAVALGPFSETKAGPIQIVFISGTDGSNWIAYFQLEQEKDGAMRIAGCTMVEDKMPMI